MRRSSFLTTAMALSALFVPVGAAAWQTVLTTPGTDVAREVIVDPAGDVVAGGTIGDTAGVVKLAGDTGGELWRREVDSVGFVSGLATDGSGDVAVLLSIGNGSTFDLAVVKLDGMTGAEMWRYTLPAVPMVSIGNAARDIGVDVAGDVFVGGAVENIATGRDFLVLKLSGPTGAELWRREITGAIPDGPDLVEALVLDASGDVVAAGALDRTIFSNDNTFVVVKLDGATGSDVWRYEEPADQVANDVTLSPDGNVVAGGGFADYKIVKLDGSTGARLWRWTETASSHIRHVRVGPDGDVIGVGPNRFVIKLSGADGTEIWVRDREASVDANGVAVDANGDLTLAGRTGEFLTTERLSGGTGEEVWQQRVAGTFPGVTIEARALAMDGFDAIPAGLLVNNNSGEDMYVARINGGVAGRRFSYRDRDGAPGLRKMVLDSERDATFLSGDAGTGADPTLHGATLTVLNQASAEADSFDLPAANWMGQGNPPGAKGYTYKDPGRTAGPCTKVRIRRERKGGRLKADCAAAPGGPAIDFSLDEPSQGSMRAELTIGAYGPRSCVEFGGTVLRDIPAIDGGTGLFKAKNAPAPTGCMQPTSPSAAFLDGGCDAALW
jgi:outer membrane protein assembly factor BamB